MYADRALGMIQIAVATSTFNMAFSAYKNCLRATQLTNREFHFYVNVFMLFFV